VGEEKKREQVFAERVSRNREQWEKRGKEPRRLRGLDRDHIVTVAVIIADAEGTEAVSMRRIAKELNVGAMSLYWYVESKEKLHQLMLDRVQAETVVAEPSGDWRADLARWARDTRAALHRHPWAIDYLGAGPPSGPHDARNADRLVGALDGHRLDTPSIMWMIMTVGTYVFGATLREIQETRWHRADAAATADMSEDEAARQRDEYARQIRDSGHYPHLAKLVDEDFDPDAPETRDERFEFGLGCVLDGIGTRLGRG
jgi:AcrR family transcriptional regulator